MRKIYSFIFAFLLISQNAYSQGILCPQNIDIWCSDDEDDLDFTGEAIATGNFVLYDTDYSDIVNTDGCNVGVIARQWFVDVNGNHQLDGAEPNCVQLINLLEVSVPFSVSFPQSKTVSCSEDTSPGTPNWSAGPCDLVAFSTETSTVQNTNAGCFTVLHKYTVINWCLYRPEDPLWNGEGIYTHTQSIQVIDLNSPVINACEDLLIEVNEHCLAALNLSLSANDEGPCASDELFWELYVDLWADGTNDYVYGPNESGVFKTTSILVNEEILINIPELVGVSSHRVLWKVFDYCGNVRACHQNIEVVDSKPPTPYCLRTISTSFENGDEPLELHVNLFDLGSFDNCNEQLKFSYSENLEDTIFLVSCDQVGPNSLKLYAHDIYGNYDYCDVNLFVSDNGSCDFEFDLEGRITLENGQAVSNSKVEIKSSEGELDEVASDEDGKFSLLNTQAFDDHFVHCTYDTQVLHGVSTFDLVLIQKHIIGDINLDSPYKLIAADINGDQKVSALDLIELRKTLLGIYESFPSGNNFTIHEPIEEWNADEFPEIIDHQMVNSYDGMMEFVGVKHGDVNSSFSAFANGLVEARDNSFDIVKSEKAGEFKYDIIVKENLEILAMQIEFTGLRSAFFTAGSNIDESHLHHKEDKLRFITSNVDGKVIHKGDVILSILSVDEIDLKISNEGFRSVWYDTQGVEHEISLRQNNSSNFDLRINPNPARDLVTLEGLVTANSRIEIFDLTGKIVWHHENLKDTEFMELNLAHLVPGTYVLNVASDQAIVAKRLIITY